MASQRLSVPCSSQLPPEQPLQVKVVGLFKSSSFQVAKSTAEVTAKKPQVWAAGPASVSSAFSWRGFRIGEGRFWLMWTGACKGRCGYWREFHLEKGYL